MVQDNFDWGAEPFPQIPMEDLVIYEMHVRGFTKHVSSGVSCPGTFSGIMEKIPYLKELGITAVELMPIFEFDEMKDSRMVDGKQVVDYWGYNPVSFFAPNTSYAGPSTTTASNASWTWSLTIRPREMNTVPAFPSRALTTTYTIC